MTSLISCGHVRVGDPLGDPAGVHHDLERRDASPVDRRNEPLTDDAAERAGQRQPHLLLLVGREEVDHAVDRLGRVDRVERRHHEVTGLGGLDRGANRLGVAHLTDQDHVGVLAKGRAERSQEVVGVVADLALVDRRDLVLVQDLDRVLDRHDVDRLRLVDVLDHRGERRGLAGAGRAGDQDQAAVLLGELADGVGQAHLLERRPAEAQPAEHHAGRSALVEHVGRGTARRPAPSRRSPSHRAARTGPGGWPGRSRRRSRSSPRTSAVRGPDGPGRSASGTSGATPP